MARRIAFLSEHASPLALLGSVDAGGQNVYVDEVSRNLMRLGYNVDIFTRRDSVRVPQIVQWESSAHSTVRIIHVPAGPAEWIPKDELWPFMPEFRDSILSFIRHEDLHYDLLHGNFWMSGWVATQLKVLLHIPAVQIFHAMGKTKHKHQGEADTSPRDRIGVEYDIIRAVDGLIAQCPSERQELVEDYDAAPDKVTIIPSAVNIQTFLPVPQDDARRQLGLDLHDPLVVYVGRMLPRKDVRNVVRGLAALMKRTDLPVKLLLVGGETPEPDPMATPEIGHLQRLSRDLGIADRVLFVGKRQPDTLRLYYSAGDVAVTTPWYEPFGLTPLEAMACGRPVIGSAVGGITYTIADGITGFLVPPHDPDALAERLHFLLRSPGLCRRMGRVARARVEREFTWSMVAQRTARLYESVLQRSPVASLTRRAGQTAHSHIDACCAETQDGLGMIGGTNSWR